MDIREILLALSPDDRALWSEHRTAMRRSFLTAHNMTVGIGNWSDKDDAFADLIDIQLALLFDRAGRLNTADPFKQVIGTEKAEAIAKDITAQSMNLNKVDAAVSQLNKNTEWPTITNGNGK